MYQQPYIKEKYKKVLSWIKYFFISILLITVGWLIFGESESICGSYEQRNLEIGGKIVKVDVSDDSCKIVLGLSGRKSMSADRGMIFIFRNSGNYGFWMKDMNFPIDILWIDNDFNITGIEKSVSTSTYPSVLGEKYLAKYVLELSSNFSDQNNIEVGNKIIFSKK